VRILGIETSCDDTAAAVVDDTGLVLSSVISNQDSFHRKYDGIVPRLLLAGIPRQLSPQ